MKTPELPLPRYLRHIEAFRESNLSSINRNLRGRNVPKHREIRRRTVNAATRLSKSPKHGTASPSGFHVMLLAAHVLATQHFQPDNAWKRTSVEITLRTVVVAFRALLWDVSALEVRHLQHEASSKSTLAPSTPKMVAATFLVTS
eukprot:gnl/MRDRNA2_/MRDRNA2_21691_c0_seq1.p1 gnl/MRDRNA2_/MRDRNA2_21691_c0~~gnl/MRDRNA2_/MRDRNA2_21691_c0_seq1.p1  ORF type:complete len:145 (-),score=11.59 gnl/MRDRNA2_/MRDRNA2_21691_c0_seq1:35-469(-)